MVENAYHHSPLPVSCFNLAFTNESCKQYGCFLHLIPTVILDNFGPFIISVFILYWWHMIAQIMPALRVIKHFDITKMSLRAPSRVLPLHLTVIRIVMNYFSPACASGSQASSFRRPPLAAHSCLPHPSVQSLGIKFYSTPFNISPV